MVVGAVVLLWWCGGGGSMGFPLPRGLMLLALVTEVAAVPMDGGGMARW